ncbi:hypothetical protein JCM17961_00260 [Endothiovibrio diazotrophicus]
MSFVNYALDLLKRRLESVESLERIAERIAANPDGVAFYPCNRLANAVLEKAASRSPDCISRIVGVFDGNPGATSLVGAEVKALADFAALSDRITTLYITSNHYLQRTERTLDEVLDGYRGEVVRLSMFDYSYPDGWSAERIVNELSDVLEMLADEKSRQTLLITMLSRTMNDEGMTEIFRTGREEEVSGDEVLYKGYRLDRMDDVCTAELFAELYEMEFIRAKEGDVVFDAGAYRGDTAVYFADLVGPSGRVHAFEPTSESYAMLRRTIDRNGLSERVTAVNSAVGEYDGEVAMAASISGAPWAFAASSGDSVAAVTTLDSYCRREGVERVDFIKLDVEGFEECVLRGARETIEKHRPVLAVSLYHSSKDILELPKLVRDLGPTELYVRCKMEGPFSLVLYCR